MKGQPGEGYQSPRRVKGMPTGGHGLECWCPRGVRRVSSQLEDPGQNPRTVMRTCTGELWWHLNK